MSSTEERIRDLEREVRLHKGWNILLGIVVVIGGGAALAVAILIFIVIDSINFAG